MAAHAPPRLPGTLCALACFLLRDAGAPLADWRHFAELAFLGHYAACQGDTWASELGTAFGPASVRLVTAPWRVVPAGTNGGVSLVGTLAALGGGLSLGALYGAVEAASGAPPRASLWFYAALGAAAASLGTLLDSLLGATLQLSLFDAKTRRVVARATPATQHIAGVDVLDNHQVNFLSALLTAAATPTLAAALR